MVDACASKLITDDHTCVQNRQIPAVIEMIIAFFAKDWFEMNKIE